MIKNEKGFGILEVLLLTAFLVFLIIPTFSAITEKVYLKYSMYRIHEVVDTAIMLSISAIDTNEFSGGDLSFENSEKIAEDIRKLIEKNKLKNVEILDFDLVFHKIGQTCSYGNFMRYNSVHLDMKISLKRIGNKAPVEFFIHRDTEFPYDR